MFVALFKSRQIQFWQPAPPPCMVRKRDGDWIRTRVLRVNQSHLFRNQTRRLPLQTCSFRNGRHNQTTFQHTTVQWVYCCNVIVFSLQHALGSYLHSRFWKVQNALAFTKLVRIFWNMKFNKVAYIKIQITLAGRHVLFHF